MYKQKTFDEWDKILNPKYFADKVACANEFGFSTITELVLCHYSNLIPVKDTAAILEVVPSTIRAYRKKLGLKCDIVKVTTCPKCGTIVARGRAK